MNYWELVVSLKSKSDIRRLNSYKVVAFFVSLERLSLVILYIYIYIYLFVIIHLL